MRSRAFLVSLFFSLSFLSACAQSLSGDTSDAIPPSTVSSLIALGAESCVVLSWTDPSDEDFSHVVISSSKLDDVTVSKGVETYTYSGFTNGTARSFTVKSYDSAGNASSGKTVTGTPTALTSVSDIVVHPGDTEVTITWTDPPYAFLESVEVSATGIATVTVDAGVESATISGLANGTAYTFALTAVDSFGNRSDSVVTEAAVPNTVSSLDTVAWVLSYFKSDSGTLAENSLYLAYSTDGLTWTALNSNNPVYTVSGIGGCRIRDPFVFRKNDGSFLYIATDWTIYGSSEAVSTSYWSNPSPYLILADSNDLITFTNLRRVKFATLGAAAEAARSAYMHCWAPEVFWDESKRKYGVIWSGDGDLDGTDYVCRTYVNYTTDFETVEDAQVFFQPGYTVIDSTIVPLGGTNYLFFKHEEGIGKDIQSASSSSFEPLSFSILNNGAYITRTTDQSTIQYTEGPFVVKDPSAEIWYLFADYYGNNGVFGCWSTTDLSAAPASWTKLSGGFSFPSGVRHANTVRVTQAELDALLNATW